MGKPTDTASKLKQEVVMTAVVNALSRAFHSSGEIDALKQIALLCGAGLLVSLLLLTYGVDLSPGFF
jgi:ribose/xylose/arabinose/galactoside ABC-type transport system permease subunit